jgi:hypothetical protein
VPEVRNSLIGASSGAFSLGLVQDLCQTPNLAGSTISFMDVDEGRLNAVHDLCCRHAGEVGIRLNIEKTVDRRESLKDADFVVNTALPAGHHGLREGREEDALSPIVVDLYLKYVAVPIGDTAHWSGARWPWWYHSSEEVDRRWRQGPPEGPWNGYFKGVARSADRIKEIAADRAVKVTEAFPGHSGERTTDMIESIACDIPPRDDRQRPERGRLRARGTSRLRGGDPLPCQRAWNPRHQSPRAPKGHHDAHPEGPGGTGGDGTAGLPVRQSRPPHRPDPHAQMGPFEATDGGIPGRHPVYAIPRKDAPAQPLKRAVTPRRRFMLTDRPASITLPALSPQGSKPWSSTTRTCT